MGSVPPRGGRPGFGSLEPGKVADLVVPDGDWTDLTGPAGRVREVYRDGELVAAGGATVASGVRAPA